MWRSFEKILESCRFFRNFFNFRAGLWESCQNIIEDPPKVENFQKFKRNKFATIWSSNFSDAFRPIQTLPDQLKFWKSRLDVDPPPHPWEKLKFDFGYFGFCLPYFMSESDFSIEIQVKNAKSLKLSSFRGIFSKIFSYIMAYDYAMLFSIKVCIWSGDARISVRGEHFRGSAKLGVRWRSPPPGRWRIFEKFQQNFIRKLQKCIILAYFSTNLKDPPRLQETYKLLGKFQQILKFFEKNAVEKSNFYIFWKDCG